MKTLAVDKYQRVRLPGVKGGERFAFENKGNGVLVLTELRPVEPKPARCKLAKDEEGALVLETDRVITTEEVQHLLAEVFP
jgi:hypothetical protein